jgi:hypothetical protein
MPRDMFCSATVIFIIADQNTDGLYAPALMNNTMFLVSQNPFSAPIIFDNKSMQISTYGNII